MPAYASFLATKKPASLASGIACRPDELDDRLFGFQRHITAWGVRRGRAAFWTDTGTGKSRMQVAWLTEILDRTPARRGLILAPLAVAEQTVREAALLGVDVDYARDQAEVDRFDSSIVITNYDRLHLFDPAEFDAVVLDESSILKDVTAKTRDRLIAAFADTPFRLACTATPAPNDVAELANHAEFLGVARREHMLSTYFIHDDSGWRLKGHAADAMWRWIATWAVAMRRPSDLGYPDDGYELPELRIVPQPVHVDTSPTDDQLFPALGGVSGRAAARRDSVPARCARVAELVAAEPNMPWLLWCGLNDEADRLAEAIPGAVNVHGSMPADQKAAVLLGFADGQIPVLVTKPSIAGWGMNWQHCARMAFVGLSDSYEAYYQCIRRCWRYGQTDPVNVHIVLSDVEAAIAANVSRKEQQVRRSQDCLIAAMRTHHAREAA